MGKDSQIEWTDHTFNPWIGCTKVSPACDHCYAEAWDRRYNSGKHWVLGAKRHKTSVANWYKPVKWDKEAAEKGVRYKVFCASLADVFDNKVDPAWRNDLWDLIRSTPNLDWLLLTKRPQNIADMLPDDWGKGYPNVWLGVTVENQEEADRRIPHLLQIPAVIRFLSCEPLLGEVDLWKPEYRCPDGSPGHGSAFAWGHGIKWVIAGGESGHNYRESKIDWFRNLRDQCIAGNAAFMFKQWGGRNRSDIKLKGRDIDGKIWNQYPEVVR